MGNNLWNLGNIDKEFQQTPNALLIEQADFFEKATNGILYAKIKNVTLRRTDIDYKLATKFCIVSPSLDNYTYTLFTVYSNPEKSYPLVIMINDDKEEDYEWFIPDFTCKDEDTFKEALAKIIRSPKTTELVQTLYAKSKNY